VTAVSGTAYVALEGAEGCGKSTQAALLAEALGAVLTRETGGTAVGARLREILHDTTVTDLADRAEALITAADRAQHVAHVVRPALAEGRAARLAGPQHLEAAGGEGVGQQRGLGALAAAVDALQGQQAAGYQGWTRRAPTITPAARASARARPAHGIQRGGVRTTSRTSASSARRA
jgi:hypothetical protein